MFYYDTNLEFTHATLLSKSEASEIPSDKRRYHIGWWLRTPALKKNQECFVNYKGSFNTCDSEYFYGIRPALVITNLGNYRVGDVFEIDNYKFKIISSKLAWLYKQDLGTQSFGETNNYWFSKIQTFVSNWYEELSQYMKEESD